MTSARPIFLVSTGRTGTKTLARVFSEGFPSVEAHHESFPFSRVLNIAGNLHVAGCVTTSGMSRLWKALKLWQIERSRHDIYVDSNHYYYSFAAAIAEVVPEARFVHVVRDPRDVVSSFLNWRRHRLRSRFAEKLVPFWEPNGFLAGDVRLRHWLGMSAFEKQCWIWKYTNQRIADQLGQTATSLRVRFEDLFSGSASEETFLRICEFIGLPEPVSSPSDLLNTRTNAPKKRSFPTWQDWPDDRCARLDSLCSPLMHAYGYGTEEDWLRKSKSEHGASSQLTSQKKEDP